MRRLLLAGVVVFIFHDSTTSSNLFISNYCYSNSVMVAAICSTNGYKNLRIRFNHSVVQCASIGGSESTR
jgi:hypothetical protein